VFMFIGYTGAAFDLDITKEVAPGGNTDVGHYNLHIARVESGENDTYAWQRLAVDVARNGKALGTLFPERRLYKASQQPTSEVSIRRRLNEDFYINFAGLSADNKRAVIQAYVFPLVSWIWIGFWVLAFGTIVCLIPNKVRLSYARTQVVGVAEKHATVEN